MVVLDEDSVNNEIPKELERSKRTLSLVRTISEALLKNKDLKDTLDTILHLLASEFEMFHTMLLLPEGDKLVVSAANGYPESALQASVPIGVSPAGIAYSKNKVVRLGNMQAQRRYLRAAAGSNAVIHSLPGLDNADSQIAIPFAIGEKPIAVLNAESTRAMVFSPEDENLLQLVVAQMAGAIENSLLILKLSENAEKERELRSKTEEALNKLRHTQDQLIHSEKMATIGKMISGIAHEVNTPLGAILASAGIVKDQLVHTLQTYQKEFLKYNESERALISKLLENSDFVEPLTSREARQIRRELEEELEEKGIEGAFELADMLVEAGLGRQKEGLKELFAFENWESMARLLYSIMNILENTKNIEVAGSKAKKVIQALKAYSHRDMGDGRQSVDIEENIEMVLTLYQNTMKHGIELERDYLTTPIIHANPDSLSQVWTNILHNALYAMKHQGKMKISIRPDGDNFIVGIGNDGPKIPDEITPKIFDPFFTTKPTGEGTGLGLDICRMIVVEHGGDISVSSTDTWTEFFIKLPLGSSSTEK